MSTPRYGNGGAHGRRQFDDTPLSDGQVIFEKGARSTIKGAGGRIKAAFNKTPKNPGIAERIATPIVTPIVRRTAKPYIAAAGATSLAGGAIGASATNNIKKADKPSRGRLVAGTMMPGYHGAVAGESGHKWQAVGNEILPSAAGGIPGNLMLQHGGMKVGSDGIARLSGKGAAAFGLMAAGQYAGANYGTRRAQRMGHYKPQSKKVKKADDTYRRYEPELRRQRRLGGAAALLGVGGAVAAGFGIKGARGATRLVRATPETSKFIAGAPRDAALIGGGAAGIGGAGAIRAHAESRRGRAYS